ncbi:MAG: PilZ domain-containing protein [bacterium]|nr:PilZ domain-containing protein [bacterium]
MHTQLHPRYKKRVPCAFEDGDSQHVGMVLNLSKGGMFVTSRAAPPVGSRVVLALNPKLGPGASGICARVVWKRVVHRSAGAVADGGIGLEIEGERDAYDRFVEGQVPAAKAEPPPEPEPTTHWVRMALAGTPRTRIVEVCATDEREAEVRALSQLGDAWRVLEVGPLRSASEES